MAKSMTGLRNRTRWLRRRWTSLPALVQGGLLLTLLFLAIQGLFLNNAWRESRIRSEIHRKGRLTTGQSPLAGTTRQTVERVIPHQQVELLSPVESIVLQEPVDTDVRTLGQCSELKSLTILRGDITAAGLSQLRGLNRLTSLYVENDRFEDRALAGLASCTKLSRLKLVGKMTPDALNPLMRCESLTELHLEGGYHEHSDTEQLQVRLTGYHLAAVARIPNLKTLLISSNNLSDIALRGLAGADRLEELVVDTLELTGDAVNALGKLPRLKQLVLEVSSTRSGALRELSGFPQLRSLALRGPGVRSEHLRSLWKLPHLETLSLDRTCLEDTLQPLSRLRSLKSLNLWLAVLPEDGLHQIGPLNKLEHLCLATTSLEETDAETLFQYFPNLNLQESRAMAHSQFSNAPRWDPPRSSRVGVGFF